MTIPKSRPTSSRSRSASGATDFAGCCRQLSGKPRLWRGESVAQRTICLPPFRYFLVLFFLAVIFTCHAVADKQTSHSEGTLELIIPRIVIAGVDFSIEIIARKGDGTVDSAFSGPVTFENVAVEVPPEEMRFINGRMNVRSVRVDFWGTEEIRVTFGNRQGVASVRAIPGFLTVFPPLLAIVLALVFRQVVVALLAGIWVGSFFIYDYRLLDSLLRVADHFIINALSSTSHVQIVVFSLLFGGMVGVISRNGGTAGIAKLVTRFSNNPRRGQLSTWVLSFLFFFDDYANVLIRGNLMRPITDRLRVSREKLAYIVDAGAATVASIFVISTWIGYEVGLIDQGLKSIGWEEDAYAVFIKTIPYRFYPIFTLILVFLVAATNRDFGPMLSAERRARLTGDVFRKGARVVGEVENSIQTQEASTVVRWWNGLLPILAVIVVALGGLYFTGREALHEAGRVSYGIGDIIGNSNSYASLLWASATGCAAAIALSVGQRILTLGESLDAWLNGMKGMLLAIVILTLAWSIGGVTEDLRIAPYIVQVLKGTLAPQWLPVLTFLLAAIISFATGTSWGTMAILMPLVVPLGFSIGSDAGLDVAHLQVIVYGNISSVLAGAVFGDHCSPISDTTILSSMASGCDHVDHVRTQLPYALLAAVIGMVVGDIPTAFGFPVGISLVIGSILLGVAMFLFGRRV